MVRLTRAQQQERTRAAVLDAARREFGDGGYRDTTIDRIAERAGLTRGAVYSNFPGKRALYLAVLLDSIDDRLAAPSALHDPGDVAAAFATDRLGRLPLAGDTAAGAGLRLRALTGVFDDEPGRAVLAQLAAVEALLLGLALEWREPWPIGPRRVRLAELVLTLLAGADERAASAPGAGDPFDVVRACRHLADLDATGDWTDGWDPPHLPFVASARPVLQAWEPPGGLFDLVAGDPVDLAADGVLVALGVGRLSAVEEAVRAVPSGQRLTVVVLTADPAELGRLVRLRIGDLAASLSRVLGAALPAPWVVLDEAGAVAAALGVPAADDTEAAVRISGGAVVARADGRGAGYAVAMASAEQS